MTKPIKTCSLFLIPLLPLLILSCIGDGYDRETIVLPELEPTIDTINCQNQLRLTSNQLTIEGPGEAWVFIGESCKDGIIESTHNYIVLLSPPDDFDFQGETTSLARIGIPGISFSFNGSPPANTDLLQIGTGIFDSFLIENFGQFGQQNWIVNDETKTNLSLIGDGEGQYLSGIITGRLSEYDGTSPGTAYPLDGIFCVPITRYCNE